MFTAILGFLKPNSKNYIYYVIILVAIVGGVVGYYLAGRGIDKKIEKVKQVDKVEFTTKFTEKLNEKDNEITQYKKQLTDLAFSSTVTTTDITKPNGERIHRRVVHRSKHKKTVIAKSSTVSNIDTTQTIAENTKKHEKTTTSSKKIDIKNILSHYSVGISKKILSVNGSQLPKNETSTTINLGVRLFNSPAWATGSYTVEDKSISVGFRWEF